MLTLGIALDQPVEEGLGARRVAGARGDLGGQQERGGSTWVLGLARGELGPELPRFLGTTAAELGPAEGELHRRRLGGGAVVGEKATIAVRRLVPVARGIARLAAEGEHGRADIRIERLAEERVKTRLGLGKLAALDVHLGEAIARVPAEGGRARIAGDELEAAARLARLLRLALELRAEEHDVGARGGLEILAQELEGEGPPFLHSMLLRGPAVHGEKHGQPQGALGIGLVEPSRLVEGGGIVADVEQGQGQARPRPQDLAQLGVGREEPAIGLHRLQGLAARAAPPGLAEQAGLDIELRSARGERGESGHGVLVVAEPAERIAEPELRLAGHGARQALGEEPRPGFARVGKAAQAVEGERASVTSPRNHLGRRARLEDVVEGLERARGLARVEQDHSVGQAAVVPDVRARLVLDGQVQRLLDTVRLLQADQRLGQPVPRLAQERPVRVLLDGVLEGLARLFEFVSLEARPPALDQLGGDPEDRPERIAREEARRGRWREGELRQVDHDPRRRERGHRLRRGRKAHRPAAHWPLVERRRHQRQHGGEIRRRQGERHLRGLRGGGAKNEAQQRERPEHPHRFSLFPPALGAGLMFAATAVLRVLAQAASVLSGLFSATSS